MPAAATGSDDACEYDSVSVALELAALSALVVLLRYAAVLYANRLLATLSVDDDDGIPIPASAAVVARARARARSGAASPPPGLDDDAIGRLPCFVIRRGAGAGAGAAAAAECAVCLGAVEDGQTARALPRCAHAFHATCVDAWLRLRPTCPVCRATCRPLNDAAVSGCS